MNLVDFFITPFIENSFMLNALIATFLVSFATAGAGSLMILRGMTFLAEAFGHGMLPGIAISIALGSYGMVGAAISAFVMIFLISFINTKTSLSHDTSIGITFITALALGVAIISYSGSFNGDLIAALFGDPLGVSHTEIQIQLIATVAILCVVFVFKRAFILLCISTDFAKTAGFNPKIYNFLILSLIAMTVVVSFKTVGTALVVGMLIAPSASALLFATNLTSSILLAGFLGTIGSYCGLLVSYHFDIAAGAAITLCSSVIFFISLASKKI